MSPINSRAKGKRGELEVVHVLRDHGWDLARRSSDGRHQGERGDIVNGPEGVSLEIKMTSKLRLYEAIDQARGDARPYDIPIVVHRRPADEWMATLPFGELLPLLRLREAA